MVTDNIVIQFVPNEKRGGLTIERRSAATPTPDTPPRTALNGEWGLADARAIASPAAKTRHVLIDFGYTPEVLQQQHVDPQDRSRRMFDAIVLEPRPLRSFRRHGRLSQCHQGQAQEQAAVLRRRRGCVLPAQESRRQFRRARPPRDHGCRSGADAVRRPAIVADHAFTTGRIGQTSFEKPLRATRRSSASSTASAASPKRCRRRRIPAHTSPTISTTRSRTVYMVKGKGLVVLTSCSHRGVINTVQGRRSRRPASTRCTR